MSYQSRSLCYRHAHLGFSIYTPTSHTSLAYRVVLIAWAVRALWRQSQGWTEHQVREMLALASLFLSTQAPVAEAAHVALSPCLRHFKCETRNLAEKFQLFIFFFVPLSHASYAGLKPLA